jgi:hypothetical protein
MARTSGSNEAMYSSTEPGLPFEGAMSVSATVLRSLTLSISGGA